MDTGLFIIRMVIGLLIAGHGAQKLFGWFGGHGLERTGDFFESLGYKPGRGYAGAAGLTEFTAGVLFVFGFLTPLASAMLIGVMVNAIVTVHLDNGLWATDGGMEYPLALSAVAAMLAFTGPGSASVDGAFAGSPATWIGVLAITVGVAAGFATLGLRSVTPALADAMRDEEPVEQDRRRAA